MKFTQTHEWIDTNNNVGTVGISDHAQVELGDIVYVELPEIGKQVRAGEEACVLESTKAAADVYSPVSGTIIEVNETLKTDCDLVNRSAQDKGWLFKIKLSNDKELEALMDETRYKNLVK